MLIIRKEQKAALAAARRKRFVARMAEYIAEEYPENFEVLRADGTSRIIARAIEVGADKGIDTEGALGVLIETMVQFGERFQWSPDREWAMGILDHPTLPGELKVTIIRERMVKRTGGKRLVPGRVR